MKVTENMIAVGGLFWWLVTRVFFSYVLTTAALGNWTAYLIYTGQMQVLKESGPPMTDEEIDRMVEQNAGHKRH